MKKHNFPVPGSIDNDKIIIFTRKHWAAFVGQLLLSIILILIPLLILLAIRSVKPLDFNNLVNNFLVLGFSTYYLIIVTYIFAAWLSFYYNLYVVTEDEIIEVTQLGFFSRQISELSLLRVQDVTSDIQGIFETLFGFGDVLVESAGEKSQNFVIKSVPNPEKLCAEIMSLHDKALETRGRGQGTGSGEGMLNPWQNKISNPPAAQETVSETPYQKMIREQGSQYQPIPPHTEDQHPNNISAPAGQPEKPPINSFSQEGEVDKDHLDQGGSIDLS